MKNSNRFCLFGIFVLLIFSFTSCKTTKKSDVLDDIPPIENLSWIKKESKNVDAHYGMIRLRSRKNLGTFNISVLDDMDKTIPLLSTSNEYITSSFYLKAGNKVIKLNQDSSVNTYSRKTLDGMQVAYVIDDVANVIVDFKCIKATEKTDIDTVKITAHVVNKGKKRTDFELKLILDTVLGETDRHHFYNAKSEPIKSEVSYKNMKAEKWFYSKNSNACMQFLFDGADTTKTELVALANLSTLTSSSWYPSMVNYRAFDTVLAYNNSAVGVNWTKKKLSLNESFEEIFYISVCYGNDTPLGNEFVYKDVKDNLEVENLQNTSKNNNSNVTSTKVEPVVENPVKEIINEDPVKEVSNKNEKEDNKKDDSKKLENVSKTKIEEYKLSKEYIQELLDKIAAIEDTGDSVTTQQLDALNRELDEILEELRK